MIDMDISTRVERVIDAHPRVAEALVLIPALYAILMQAASEHPRNRWEAYERLKVAASHHVGHEAYARVLQTQAHYESMLHAIDELLPVDSEDVA